MSHDKILQVVSFIFRLLIIKDSVVLLEYKLVSAVIVAIVFSFDIFIVGSVISMVSSGIVSVSINSVVSMGIVSFSIVSIDSAS